MENKNWTQPAGYAGGPQLLGNPAAPFINSLVTPGHPNSANVSFAAKYHNVVADGRVLHPSEPNYVWGEAGTAGPLSDADPYPANIVTAPHLSGALQSAGKSWRSYQEDIDLAVDPAGQVTSNSLPESQWTVPLRSLSGTSASYTNAYNGSHLFDYAAKHNPQLFFADTNGGTSSAADASSTNPLSRNYVPLSRLADDLRTNNVAQYNWITPNQFNDMHTPLPSGFTYLGTSYTGYQASVAQGDNFLAQVIPLIMKSAAYQDGGLIVIWTDETVGDNPSTAGAFTGLEIIISPLAKGNAYAGQVAYDHTSDLLTMQKIFGVRDFRLNGAAANDLSDLFLPGTFP